MAQEKRNIKARGARDSSQAAGRGGARAGAGRKAGSGAFGEATVPMRVPVSLAGEVGELLDAFKSGVGKRKEAAEKIAPLCAKGLRDKAAHLVELAGTAPSGRPVDISRVVANRPETCYAWTATSDCGPWGVKAGDTVVIDRAGKASSGCLAAFWLPGGVELLSVEEDKMGARALWPGSGLAERHGAAVADLEAWGIVVGIARRIA